MSGSEIWADVAADVDLTVAPEQRRRIGVVGAGAIVDNAHLPAYAAAGLEVVAIHDLDADRAADVAARHGIATVHSTLSAMLDDPSVEVVDVAVVAHAQPDIVRATVAAGKHLLCQKPFTPDLQTGRELVELARAAGVHIAVNQQMRFEEGIAAARSMVERGWIGEPTAMEFRTNIATDFSQWPWLLASERLEVSYHSIHYLDSIRSILGDPERVFCHGGRRPGQAPRAETRTMSTLVYPDGVGAVLHVNHENIAGDVRAEFRIDGSEGSIRGTIGLLYDYPHGRPDTVELFSRVLPTDGWLPYPVTRRWIPDAFVGPMAGLLAAVAEGGEAPTAAADNLHTLALVEALYASMQTREAQKVEA
ncbi:Gfo/Idh/MocA family protein [Aeromicrobium sp. CF4.19]|uniref:Gfo/Idh/MocA family protein n=1 Tax=Aeromicrobium sp. CF4.19 TaxID=3373082 RepID=UPI003EE46D3D